MRKIPFLFFFIAVSILWACNDDEKKQEGGYDPTKPVEIMNFMPDEGRLREKVIIKGSNFGNDKSKVQVYFVDGTAERSATIIGVDNNTIYCLAPRQLPGDNTIKVVVGEKDFTTVETFNYSQAENVTTISGMASDRKTLDGSLSEARFGRCMGIAALGDESVLVFQGYGDYGAGVRLVSVPDNKVVTIQAGYYAGKPAVKKDKSAVYSVGRLSPHVIYQYTKEVGWTPMRIGQLGSDYKDIFTCALDKDEEWVYFIDLGKKFGRFNINNQNIEVISNQLNISGNSLIFMTYHPQHDCFYVSSEAGFMIYKLTKDGTLTLFSGSSNSANTIDGPIADASFFGPRGLTVDEDGNIYVMQGGTNHHVLRKIILDQDFVSTIGGRKGVGGSQVDGNPLEAGFNWGSDICYDGDGGFWIAEDWGCAVRKYAVE